MIASEALFLIVGFFAVTSGAASPEKLSHGYRPPLSPNFGGSQPPLQPHFEPHQEDASVDLHTQRSLNGFQPQEIHFPDDHPQYSFEYVVKDDYGNDFGHQEERDGYNTKGTYYVALPDGRKQNVNYYVDGDSGYVAEVSYEGEAAFPETYGQRYQPQPAFDGTGSHQVQKPDVGFGGGDFQQVQNPDFGLNGGDIQQAQNSDFGIGGGDFQQVQNPDFGINGGDFQQVQNTDFGIGGGDFQQVQQPDFGPVENGLQSQQPNAGFGIEPRIGFRQPIQEFPNLQQRGFSGKIKSRY